MHEPALPTETRYPLVKTDTHNISIYLSIYLYTSRNCSPLDALSTKLRQTGMHGINFESTGQRRLGVKPNS